MGVIFYGKCAEKSCKKRVRQKSRQINPHRYADFFVCVQIDQNGTGWTEAQLATDLTAGTKFVVLSGGDGKLYTSAMYEVTKADPENPFADCTRLIGNVTDGDTAIDISDVTAILQHNAFIERLSGERLQAADVTDDGTVDISDVTAVLQYNAFIDRETYVDGKKTVADKKNYVEESTK